MLFTVFLTSAIGFQPTLFATQVLLLRLLLHAYFSLAVDHASKVRFFTLEALVKRARVHRQTEEVAVIEVTLLLESFMLVESLHPSCF